MKHPALSSRENLKMPQNSKGDRDENKGHNGGKGGMRDRRNGPFYSRVDPDRAGTDVSTDNRNFCRFPRAGSCILFLQARPVGASSRERNGARCFGADRVFGTSYRTDAPGLRMLG